jgi:hypothetical protein
MSWSSLFAFSNPNGRIGSTYEATFTPPSIPYTANPSSAVTETLNIYTFSSLPVGLYSINIQLSFSLSGSGIDINSFETGVGLLPTSSLLYPNNYNISTGNIIITSYPFYFNSTLLLRVTDANPIYINIVYNANGSYSIQSESGFYCIATKLA